MRIAIDTKEDSVADIKKVIRLLQQLAGEESGEIRENMPEVKEGLFSLFDQPPQETQAQDRETFRVDEFIEKKKREDEESGVIPYD